MRDRKTIGVSSENTKKCTKVDFDEVGIKYATLNLRDRMKRFCLYENAKPRGRRSKERMPDGKANGSGEKKKYFIRPLEGGGGERWMA